MPTDVDPTFFATPSLFRRWLEKHHRKAPFLWVGFHKKATGKPCITWPESVDQALCFGWIDGQRKSLDASRYMIRFTPRRPRSIWSAVNVRRVAALKKAGHMRPAGLDAFAKRQASRSGIYSFENRPRRLPPSYEKQLRANRDAWSHFQSRPPSYRRAAIWWVISAKQEATRERRLASLIRACMAQEPIALLRPRPGKS
jgi:uncharacterized protein YdeI (YjbR/CyaY-like superfamily)